MYAEKRTKEIEKKIKREIKKEREKLKKARAYYVARALKAICSKKPEVFALFLWKEIGKDKYKTLTRMVLKKSRNRR